MYHLYNIRNEHLNTTVMATIKIYKSNSRKNHFSTYEIVMNVLSRRIGPMKVGITGNYERLEYKTAEAKPKKIIVSLSKPEKPLFAIQTYNGTLYYVSK